MAGGGAGGNNSNNSGGGSGGFAGSFPSGTGGGGGMATTPDGGGGGGGGGGFGDTTVGSGTIGGFSLTGGTGGTGGAATNGGGGGGGAGGSGEVVQGGGGALTISSGTTNLQGGNGGTGGAATNGTGGNGGDGGAGLTLRNNGIVLTLGGGVNATALNGGTGGSGGAAAGGNGLGGNGGAGIETIGTGVTIALNGSATVTGGNSFGGVQANAITFTGGANTLTLNGGTINGNIGDDGGGSVTFNQSTAATLSNAITSNGSVIDSGIGTLSFSTANTYTGSTTISAGTLALTGAGSIATSSGLVDNATFDLTGAGSTTAIKTLSGSGTVSLGSYGLFISAASTEFSGGIGGGSGGLEIGSGTQTLSGTNTYTNATQIDSGATLALKGNGSIANTLYLGFSGTGIFDISQTTAGASVGGLFGFSGTVSLGAQTLTITNGSFYNGVIQDGGIGGGGGGGITIAANAVQQLGGADTYTGLTTINAMGELDLTQAGFHQIGFGSIATSRAVIADGIFDVSGLGNGVTPVSTSIMSLSGAGTGSVFLGVNNLTITNANGTFAGVIADGFNGPGGSLTLAAGQEILSGVNTYTGATIVNGGVLDITGSIATSLLTTVNANATLTGTGTVGATTINTNGILAPGNGTSGSSMTVSGSLALLSGAQYFVLLNPTTSSFTNVTGTAMLGGATVNTFYASGNYISKRYTILTAGHVDGIFSSLVNTNLPSGFKDSLSYDATHAYLDLAIGFTTPGGLNVNQQHVANALTNFFNGSGGIPLVFGTLTPAGLTQASGELATGSQQTTFNAMNQFIGVMTDPFIAGRGDGMASGGSATGYADEALGYAKRKPNDALAAIYTKALRAPSFEQRWSTWIAGYGGSQSTDGNAVQGSNNTTSGVYGKAVGADYRFSPNTLAGFAIAGGGTNFGVAGAGNGHSDLFQAGAFIRHSNGAAYISAALAYGWQDVTTNRTVTAAGFDQYQARFNANTYSGRVEGGYRFVTPAFGGIGLTPYAAGQFTTFDLPSYAESVLAGANTFALAYGAKSVTDTRSELGLRSDKSFVVQGGIFTVRGRAAWAHDYDPNRATGASFQALPGASFVVNGARQAGDSALTTASAEMKWSSGWSAAATFEGEFSDVTRSYAGKGVVRYVW